MAARLQNAVTTSSDFRAPVLMSETRVEASWSSVMESSFAERRPHVRGISRTFKVAVDVNWDVRDEGRRQFSGIWS